MSAYDNYLNDARSKLANNQHPTVDPNASDHVRKQQEAAAEQARREQEEQRRKASGR